MPRLAGPAIAACRRDRDAVHFDQAKGSGRHDVAIRAVEAPLNRAPARVCTWKKIAEYFHS